MRFDSPAALLLLLFLALLFFTRRHRAQTRRAVGNLYLWKEAASTDAPWLARHVRRHLLLILQIACLCALAVSIARPEVVDTSVPVAVVLDTSMSMGARDGDATRLEVARSRIRALLDSLPGSTAVRFIAAGVSPRDIGSFHASDDAGWSAIENVSVTDAAADIASAIQQARAGTLSPQRVYVYSDANRATVAGASATDVEWFQVGRAADNAAVVNLAVRRLPDAPGRMSVLVGVANHGADALSSVVTLARDGVEIARVPIQVGAATATSSTVSIDAMGGALAARLEYRDALSADNTRILVVSPGPQVRVLAEEPLSPFLEQALRAHPEVILAGDDGQAHDVVICDGCRQMPAGAAGVLLIPPRPSNAASPAPLTKTTGAHPLAHGLELDGVVAVPLRLDASPADAAVVAHVDGSPALVAYETAGRRVVEMRIDPDRAALPYSAAFPVLVSNAVTWLANGREFPAAIAAGEPLRWAAGPLRQPPIVLAPGGRTAGSVFTNGVLSVADTATAGVYRVRADGMERSFAVNPAAAQESDLTAVSATAAAASSAAPAAPRYRDARQLVMLAALLFLAIEWRQRFRRPGLA